MSATTDQINVLEGKLSEAAKAMREHQVQNEGTPLGELPAGFHAAKAVAEQAMEELNKAKAVKSELDDADAIYAQAFNPKTGQPKFGNVEAGTGDVTIGIPERMQQGRPSRRNGVRAGSNHEMRLAPRIDPKAHWAAANDYLRGGDLRLMEKHGNIRNELMRTTTGETGQFAVPGDFRAELLSDIAAVSVLFDMGRKIPTSTNEAYWPTLANAAASPRIYRTGYQESMGRVAEGLIGQTAPLSGATATIMPLSFKRIPVHTWSNEAVPIVFTPEQVDDQAVDLLSIAQEVIREASALAFDSEGIAGTGVGEAKGILDYADGTTEQTIERVPTGSSAILTFAGFVNLVFGDPGLPTQYRPGAVHLMHTDTYANALLINDSAATDRPLINAAATPDQILGFPIVFSEFMNIVAADTDVSIFGNLNQYGFAMRTDLTIEQIKGPHAPNTTIFARHRWGGDVLRTRAFKILHVDA